MADFMCDDVGLSEVTGGAKAVREFIEEGQIQIHLVIGRTVKRPDDR